MALILLIFGFFPAGPDPYFPRASKLTPLDSTILTYGTLRHEMRGDMYFWLYSTEYFNSCPPFQQISLRTTFHDAIQSKKCNGDGFLFSTMSRMHEIELTTIEPKFPAILDEYEAAINSERNEPKEEQFNIVHNKPIQITGASTRRLMLEFEIGNVMNKYLETRKVGIATTIYVLHGILILAFLFMVWGRRFIGNLIWFPFSLIIKASRTVGRAAKETHNKI